MNIEKMKKEVRGSMVEIAPYSIFDAIEVSETDHTTLTEVINAFTKLHDIITCVMKWNDNNPANEDRIGRFVTLVPNQGTIAIAGPNDRIFGITVPNDVVDGIKTVTVCLYGSAVIECGMKVFKSNMTNKTIGISNSGRGIIKDNKRWYDVVSFVDEYHVEIFFKPQVDTINRIADQLDDIYDRFPASIRFDIEDDEVTMTHK